jgi:hypothetical protein
VLIPSALAYSNERQTNERSDQHNVRDKYEIQCDEKCGFKFEILD